MKISKFQNKPTCPYPLFILAIKNSKYLFDKEVLSDTTG
jgi:hypothetical protein